MTTVDKKIIDGLNRLIKICNDGRLGYVAAVENVNNISLKEIFIDYSCQRSGYASDIKDYVRKIGGIPENRKSYSAMVHRAWINIRGTFSKSDGKAMLQECMSGDVTASKAYREILGYDLPSDLRRLLEEQLNGIVTAYTLVKTSYEMIATRSVAES